MIDALNVLRSGWPWPAPEELVAAVVALADPAGVDDADLALVVIDGSWPDAAIAAAGAASTQVRLVGSAGRSADDVIVEEVRRLRRDEPRTDIAVATSDRGLRSRLEPFSVELIGGGSIARQLGLHGRSR